MGTGQDKLRVNPRKSWYNNLEAVTTNGDFEVAFRLKQPQPALLALLASGWSPIYPCHVAPAQMRQHPIGTGPFKFVEFKPNQSIKLVKNPDYWKQGRPYLDGIDFSIMREIAPRQSRLLCRRARCRYALSRDPADARGLQGAGAGCDLRADLGQRAAHDADQYRQAALRQSRTAAGDDAGDRPRRVLENHQRRREEYRRPDAAAVERRLGMPEDRLRVLPGYNPDVEKNRAEAREIMKKLGYGPDNPLRTKIATRNIPSWRNPAVLLNSQLKEIWIDTELEIIDTAQWYPKINRKDFTIGAVPIEAGVDDPDMMFYENFYSGALRNYSGISDPELDKMIDRQSMEANPEKRKQLVWEMRKSWPRRRCAQCCSSRWAIAAGGPGSRT